MMIMLLTRQIRKLLARLVFQTRSDEADVRRDQSSSPILV
jgi:hypothetical protein